MILRPLSSTSSRALVFCAVLTIGGLAAAAASSAAPRAGYAVPASAPHPQPAGNPAPTVTLNTIYSFSVPDANGFNADGAQSSTLVPDGQGNFLGTANRAGAANSGTIFQVAPDGTFSTLYSFSATTFDGPTETFRNADGASPSAALLPDGQGNFYGTTPSGGTGGGGTIFKLTTDGTAAGTTFTTLYTFSPVVFDQKAAAYINTDGAQPFAGLVRDGQGNFYGVTSAGGDAGNGTVFKLTTDGTAAGTTLTRLHSFTADPYNSSLGNSVNADGAAPEATLVADGQGNFLGVTPYGGGNDSGTIFQVTPAGVLTTLYNFTKVIPGDPNSSNADGAHSNSALVADGLGNFYGTTPSGGSNNNGTLFKITTDGTPAGTTFTLLHDFSATVYDGSGNFINADGATPAAPLVHGLDGNFYGTTPAGGTDGQGTVLELTPAGDLLTLYNFTAGTDGGRPGNALLQTDSATFYGVTAQLASSGTVQLADRVSGAPSATDYGRIFHLNVIPAAGEIGFGGGTTTVSENAGSAQVTISRTGGGTGAVSVAYATADGTARAGTDYATASGTLTWADGDATDKIITVPILDRQLTTGSGTFTVTLGAPTGGAILLNATGPSVSEQLTILDNDVTPAPVITSALAASVQTGQSFVYQIAASNSPTSFGATGLPTGLQVDATSGLITGAAASIGTFPVKLFATNKTGTGTATLTLTITAQPVIAPVITSPATASGQVGAPFSYQIAASHSPTSFGTGLLPTGLSVDIATGLITGTPTGAGTFPITLYAANAGGTGTATLTLTITTTTVTGAPTLALTSPPDGITVVAGETVPLAASVSDPDAVLASVQFLVNGQVVATAPAGGPYTATATIGAPGSYVLTAVALDTQGRTNSSTVNVTAVAADAANPVPDVALLTPIDGRDFASDATLTITATAQTASPAGLDHVTISVDGIVIGAFNPDGSSRGTGSSFSPAGSSVHRQSAGYSPLSTLFTTTYKMPGIDKLITMIVAATDKLNHTNISSVVSFHSKVTADRAPLVSFSNLSALAKVTVGTVNTAQISASDPDAATATKGFARQDAGSDALLAQLEYFINGISVGHSAQPPFAFSFSPPSAGKYILHAVATDGSGLATVSDPVVVEADAPVAVVPPVVTALTGGDGFAREGGENGKVAVRRTGDFSTALTVRYKVAGSAKSGVDYKPVTGTVTIPVGAAQAKVKIKPIDNKTVDGTRVAKVKLLPSLDGSYTLGTAAVAKIRIIDNDR